MTRWAPGTAEPFPKTLWFGYRQDDRSDAGETELGYCLRGHREKNDRPLDPIVELALGVPGEGMISEGVAVSWATQGAVRDPLGHWWVDYVATTPLQTRAEVGGGVSAAVPLWQPHGWVFHRVCPAQPSRLTQQYRVERSVGQERQRRLPVYPASARTRGGTAPLFLWLPVIVAVRLLGGWEGADPGTLLAAIHSHSTRQGGEGPPQGGIRLRGFFKAVRRHL